MNNHKVLALSDFGGSRVRNIYKGLSGSIWYFNNKVPYSNIGKIILFGWQILQNYRLHTLKNNGNHYSPYHDEQHFNKARRFILEK